MKNGKSKYALTESQVEALAREGAEAVATTGRVGLTYLRVLVVGVQARVGSSVPRGRRQNVTASHLEALELIHDRFYPAVLRGITNRENSHDDTLPKAEQALRARDRNQKSAFARAAKSTLVSYIRTGGDIRGLDGETVTRDPLAATVRRVRGVSEVAYKLGRLTRSIARIVTQEARGDPDTARDDIDRVIAELQAARDKLTEAPENGEATHTMSQVMRSRPVHARHAGARA